MEVQNGEIWSRGLPASCVMIVLSRSTVCIRSQITRYGLSGASLDVSSGSHLSIHGFFTAWISAATGEASRGLEIMPPSSASIASNVSPASPTSPIWQRTSLSICRGSSVAWMMDFPFGIETPKLVSVNEQPIPKMTSD